MIHAVQGDAPYRVEITAGGHLLTADETAALGGGGTAPGPFDLVVAGLAACTLITLRMYALRKGWTAVTLSAELRHRVAEGAHMIDRRISVSGAPDAAAIARLADIVERTPVTLALRSGFTISTELTPASA
jgi:putative redox protein